MLKATVNDTQVLEVEKENDQLTIDSKPFSWDFQQVSDKDFHILKDNKSYNVELVEADYQQKIFKIKVNGKIETVQLRDKTDMLLEKMGIAAGASAKLNNLKAPMPGLIYDLKVKVGDEVQKGDVLLILVAMKMENAIKAPGNGKVKAIKVSLNDSVEKGQLIMEFE